jgi:secreted PhoX family phosphatase
VGSQLWAYVGTKQKSGPPIAKAGLTNGADFVIDAIDETVSTDAQWRTKFAKNPARVDLAQIDWNQTGAAQNTQAVSAGLSLNRIEDGHWDPNHPNDFYFLTTEGGINNGLPSNSIDFRDGGGLWRLRFDDIEHPSAGGSLQLLLDGDESLGTGEPLMNKPDNMGIDGHGNLLIQEDPGSNNHIARVIAYQISDGALAVLARFDPTLFGPGSNTDPNRLTIDEESSGIIDTEPFLGAGTFVLDAQVHTSKGLPAGTGPGTVQEFVERGQLLRLIVDDWGTVYGV